MHEKTPLIRLSKREDMPTIEKIKPNLSESDKRNQRSRLILKTVIIAATTIAIVLFAWAVWLVWGLLGL